MRIIKPSYYSTFRCIGGACPDSCCKEWDILVDEATAKWYRAIPGALGEKLRSSLFLSPEGEPYLTQTNGHCPLWRADGLCEIHTSLGPDALCDTCRNFPRLTHDYGDFCELGLELSCPEAARLILSDPHPFCLADIVSGGQEPEYSKDTMNLLLCTRETARTLLSDTSRPANEALVLLLMYGHHAQDALDSGEVVPFSPNDALTAARSFAVFGGAAALVDFFRQLETLAPDFFAVQLSSAPAPWSDKYRALARYFVDRYWLQAVSDYDLVSRVKMAVASCLVIRTLGGDIVQTAQRFSKEIENDIDNVDTILDSAYTASALTDAALLGGLLA